MKTITVYLRGKAKSALGEIKVDAACAEELGVGEGQHVSKAQMQDLMLMQLYRFSADAEAIEAGMRRRAERKGNKE